MTHVQTCFATAGLSVILCLALQAQSANGQPAQRPTNVLLLLADDLGYGDLACYGHPTIKTPHLDRLAADGVRFTQCYSAAPNCSPARAGLLTGRTPYRAGIHNWIPFLSPIHLRADEVTIATLLHENGYDTCHVGKWHLNGMFNLPGQPQPGDHGFAHWFSAQNNALPNHRNPYNFVRNGIPMGPQDGYSSEIVANEACRWLSDVHDAAKPFFLFVCFHEPHEPIATAEQHTRWYDYPNDPSRVAYYGNVTQMDAAVGKLLAKVDELRLRDSTLVMFTSDNGPARTRWHNAGSSGPLRQYKGHLYEGGIRVPGIVRWPGHTTAGMVSDEPVCGLDLFPTVCDIAGFSPPENRALDGVSMLPVLAGKPLKRTSPLYWQFNWSQSAPKAALRQGDWKILAALDRPMQANVNITEADNHSIKRAELAKFELYNVATDPGETTELSSREPGKLQEMTALLQDRYRQVREETPIWPAWEWPRYEAQRIEWPTYTAPPLKSR